MNNSKLLNKLCNIENDVENLVSTGISITGTSDTNIIEILGNPISTSSGNLNAQSIRVAICTDDINQASINVATSNIDANLNDVIQVSSAAITQGVLVGGSDSGGLFRPLLMDGAGRQEICLDRVGNATTNTNIGSVGAGTLRVTLGTTDPLTLQIQTDVSQNTVALQIIQSSTTSLNTKLPTQGQSIMDSSLPVTIASNQSNVPTNTVLIGGSSISQTSGIQNINVNNTLLNVFDQSNNNLLLDISTNQLTGNVDLSTIASDITNIKEEQFNIRKHQNSSLPSFEITAYFSNFTSGSNNFTPDNFVDSFGLLFTTQTQLEMASDSATDTSRTLFIQGYDNSGVKISEILALDGSDSRTEVTSVNSYMSVTNFQYDNIPRSWNGIISLADDSATWTNGNPSSALAQIPADATTNQAYISYLTTPDNKKMVLHQLEFQLIEYTASTDHQMLELVKVNTNPSPFTQDWELLDSWRVTDNLKLLNYDAGRIITHHRLDNNEVIFFRIRGLNTDANGLIKVRCLFSWL